ncbi:Tethering factor for nuclear proteasome STS1 [Colletotrichum tanaceti]|uniref:Tethering factor for nuclear proteasome STS1 n=1 Tax=Colletotrichum tanaceti TaxID=1306861 RepID=A0A4U6XQ81_9PEZI|nr:Tethering factor for nuclear proteasome STS1 [Colletotrichum tanaceti]TKW57931.1 Tethering factor for nuclear proteasome STS1 [Colletotrichum tanaceti]
MGGWRAKPASARCLAGSQWSSDPVIQLQQQTRHLECKVQHVQSLKRGAKEGRLLFFSLSSPSLPPSHSCSLATHTAQPSTHSPPSSLLLLSCFPSHSHSNSHSHNTPTVNQSNKPASSRPSVSFPTPLLNPLKSIKASEFLVPPGLLSSSPVGRKRRRHQSHSYSRTPARLNPNMNVLLSPQPPLFQHPREANRISPSRSLSPFHNMATTSRKRKADEDGDEMSLSPRSSPSASSRQLQRPLKKVRSNELVGRPLSLPRMLETLEPTSVRALLVRICERHPEIGQEVINSAPRPTVAAAHGVLQEYQEKMKAAIPYGETSADYTYYRVKAPLTALIDALLDFTPQYLPPNETQTTVSLQYLDGATKIIHALPDWEPQQYRHHKENAYDEISKAWALVINEAAKRGGGLSLHTGGWDQTLAKHHEISGGRMGTAMNSMATSVSWMAHGGSSNGQQPGNPPSDPNSILNQLMSGTYGAPVRVGPW